MSTTETYTEMQNRFSAEVKLTGMNSRASYTRI